MFLKGQPCERCGRPLDAPKDCPCTPPRPTPKPPPAERVGIEDLKQLDAKFLEDLDAVFEDRHQEFGDHLRGMLLELWTRARGTKSDIVKELEELRELKKEKLELKELVSSVIKAELPAVAQQFKASFEDVMGTNFRAHLVAELENPNSYDIDAALSSALERVLELSGSLEGRASADRFLLEASGSSTISALPELDESTNQPDKTQQVLHRRLEFAGLLPPSDFSSSWSWKPVFLNTESGERAAFSYDDWRERWPLSDYREVRVPLAWDGTAWLFPNPRPLGRNGDIGSLTDVITIIADGVEQSSADFWGWCWHWNGNQAVSVSGISGASSGTELVEARYYIVPESYRA